MRSQQNAKGKKANVLFYQRRARKNHQALGLTPCRMRSYVAGARQFFVARRTLAIAIRPHRA